MSPRQISFTPARTPARAPPTHARCPADPGDSLRRQEVCYPSSTPLANGRRFLLWNLTGMVLSRDEQTYAAIEVGSPTISRNLSTI